MRNYAGYKTSWMESVESTEVQELEQIQTISNVTETQPQLTSAHLELQLRITLVENAISGKNFAKMEAKKKREFLEEYKWLISLNAQLGA